MFLLSPRSACGILTISSAGLQLSPPIVFFWGGDLSSYYSYSALSSFRFSRFARVYVLLCLVIATVRISSLTERLSSKLL